MYYFIIKIFFDPTFKHLLCTLYGEEKIPSERQKTIRKTMKTKIKAV